MPQRPQQTFLQSLKVARRGVCEAAQEQRNLRTHFVITLAVFAIALILQVSLMAWSVLVLCVSLVIGCELLNTAIETVVDLVSPQEHELARKAKDISAGAVLVVTLGSICIGLLILLPPLIAAILQYQ